MLPDRIALGKPAECEPNIQFVRQCLFGRHGLVPDLMNSREWKLKLRAIAMSEADPNLKQAAFKSMSYSPVRFDSESGPVRQLVDMLVPVIILLASMSFLATAGHN